MNPKAKTMGRLWRHSIGYPAVGWMGLHLAPHLGDGLAVSLPRFNRPWSIRFQSFCSQFSEMCVGLSRDLCPLCGDSPVLPTKYPKRRRTRFRQRGSPKAICRKYRDRDHTQNRILTQNVRMGLDTHKHRRNLNVLVVGGSGAGKTRFYAKPNLFQQILHSWCWTPRGN